MLEKKIVPAEVEIAVDSDDVSDLDDYDVESYDDEDDE